MTTKLYQRGERITFTNGTGSAISSGDVVAVGAILAVASVDIPVDGVGELEIGAVYEVPKKSADTIAQGDSLAWDASAGVFTNNLGTAASGDISGSVTAWEGAASATGTVYAFLPQVPGTLTP